MLFCLFFKFLLLDFFRYVRAGVKRLIATRKKTENNTKQITKKTSRYFCYLFLSREVLGQFLGLFICHIFDLWPHFQLITLSTFPIRIKTFLRGESAGAGEGRTPHTLPLTENTLSVQFVLKCPKAMNKSLKQKGAFFINN